MVTQLAPRHDSDAMLRETIHDLVRETDQLQHQIKAQAILIDALRAKLRAARLPAHPALAVHRDGPGHLLPRSLTQAWLELRAVISACPIEAIGELVIDAVTFELVGPAGRARPTLREWEILLLMAGAPAGQWTPTPILTDAIFGPKTGESISRTNVWRLKLKLRAIGCEHILENRQYLGYRLVGARRLKGEV